MNYKIKFTEKVYSELNHYLFKLSPKENGCFILGNKIGKLIFITQIYYPEKENWVIRDLDLCSPTSDYISSACLKADILNKVLIFVHSHPEVNHPSMFSELDIYSNAKLFNNLKDILSTPIGSFVFSKKGIHGVLYYKSAYIEIDSYTILGKTFQKITDQSYKPYYPKSTDSKFDRQLRFIKKTDFNSLQVLKIAIVGLGGIGSPLAVMLAKMGVQNLSFFDFDKVEIHNLPRIYGANENDIGKYKIEVVKNHINTFSKCKINTYPVKIDNSHDRFKEFDVIYGCLDNHTARAILNTISCSLAIPYIDAGCAIPLDEESNVIQAITALTTVMPCNPCLWCSNVINPMIIMEENLSKKELKQRKQDGYTQKVEKAPSIITLTTAVATMAANRLLNLVGIFSENYPVRVIYDFNESMMVEPDISINNKCSCQKESPFNK
ncbi:MAG: ThiF family adenylyltransferase [Flavobacteriaceae bacterium]